MRVLVFILISFMFLTPKLLAQKGSTSCDFNYQPFISLAHFYQGEKMESQKAKSLVKLNRSLGVGLTFMLTNRFSLSFSIADVSFNSNLMLYNQNAPKDSVSYLESFQSRFTSIGLSPAYYFWFSNFYLAPHIHIQVNKLGLAGFTIDGQPDYSDLTGKNWFQRYGTGLQVGYLFLKTLSVGLDIDVYTPTIGLNKRYDNFVNTINMGLGLSLKYFFESPTKD